MTEFGQIYFWLGAIFGQLFAEIEVLSFNDALNSGNSNLYTHRNSP